MEWKYTVRDSKEIHKMKMDLKRKPTIFQKKYQRKSLIQRETMKYWENSAVIRRISALQS